MFAPVLFPLQALVALAKLSHVHIQASQNLVKGSGKNEMSQNRRVTLLIFQKIVTAKTSARPVVISTSASSLTLCASNQ